jgi:hypothetical protein
MTTYMMLDWQITDGQGEDLLDHLKREYTVAVSKGPYDNLVLEKSSPTGTKSMLRIEAENGQFKLIVYCPDGEQPGVDRDECDAICHITERGFLAYPNTSDQPGVLLDKGQIYKVMPEAIRDFLAGREPAKDGSPA